jgi:hypothetical protein
VAGGRVAQAFNLAVTTGWLAHAFHACITLTEAAPPLRLRSGQALCDFQRVGFSSSLHRGRFTTSVAHVLLYALLILKMLTGLPSKFSFQSPAV